MASTASEGYRALRERVLAMAHAIGPTQAELTVPCCPAWTVRNLLSHMAGVPADIVAGNLEGVTTDPWTQAQVDARADEPLDNVLIELAEKGAIVDTLLDAGPFPATFFIDAWTHEWDLRQALGQPAAPDFSMLEGAPFEFAVASATRRFDERGLAPIDLRVDGETHRIGSSSHEPLTLTTSRFEYLRLALGRRSLGQIARLDWSGEPGRAAEALVSFTPSEADITDPVL